MATSSITHNFVISDKKTANKFVNIIDSPVVAKASSVSYKMVSNPSEISSLLERRKKSSAK